MFAIFVVFLIPFSYQKKELLQTLAVLFLITNVIFFDDQGAFWQENGKLITLFSEEFQNVDIEYNGSNIQISSSIHDDNEDIDNILQEVLAAEIFVDALASKFFSQWKETK